MKYFLLILIIFISSGAGFSFSQTRNLSQAQVERVRSYKELIKDVDKKSLARSIADLESSRDPEMNLAIQETIARVYREIVREQAITDQQTKEWLYNAVAVNMANLQFGGWAGRDPVHQMIAGRLKAALPRAVAENPNFSVSVE